MLRRFWIVLALSALPDESLTFVITTRTPCANRLIKSQQSTQRALAPMAIATSSFVPPVGGVLSGLLISAMGTRVAPSIITFILSHRFKLLTFVLGTLLGKVLRSLFLSTSPAKPLVPTEAQSRQTVTDMHGSSTGKQLESRAAAVDDSPPAGLQDARLNLAEALDVLAFSVPGAPPLGSAGSALSEASSAATDALWDSFTNFTIGMIVT